MNTLKFTPEMFNKCQGYPFESANKLAADICNLHFEDWLNSQPLAYGNLDPKSFIIVEGTIPPGYTHTARIVDIQAIKPCYHNVIINIIGTIGRCESCDKRLTLIQKWELAE